MGNNIRYFQTEEQESDLADILTEKAKNQQQAKAQTAREFILEVLSNMAVLADKNFKMVKNKGLYPFADGSSMDLTKDDVEVMPFVESDVNWTPKNPDAKVKVITMSGNLLINSLALGARLQNAVHKKIGGDGKKYPCIEAYVNDILTDTVIMNSAGVLKKDLDAEIKASLAEKEENKSDKPEPAAG